MNGWPYLTRPEPQKIDPTQPGSKNFDPNPSLVGMSKLYLSIIKFVSLKGRWCIINNFLWFCNRIGLSLLPAWYWLFVSITFELWVVQYRRWSNSNVYFICKTVCMSKLYFSGIKFFSLKELFVQRCPFCQQKSFILYAFSYISKEKERVNGFFP